MASHEFKPSNSPRPASGQPAPGSRPSTFSSETAVSHGLLLQHLDALAETPGAVAKLRGLVLDLSERGAFGGAEADVVKLGAVAEFVMGQAPAGSECNTSGEGTVFVKAGEFGPLYAETRCWTTDPLKLAKKGDVLICVVGATVGKLNLGIDCAIGRSVAAIRPAAELDTRFLYYSLMPFTLRMRRSARGSAQGVIGRSELSGITIRLPSLTEQRRIVAKVEELLALCDELEARQTAAREHRTRLVRSALDHLTIAPDEATFRQHAAFIFHPSSSILEAVPALRQAILSLAVHGRLSSVRNHPEPQSDSTDGLPCGWRWVKLADVAHHRLGKMLDNQKNRGTARPYLRNTNVHWFTFKLETIKEMLLEDEELATYELMAGDVLICEGGHGIGRTAVWNGELPAMVFQKALHRVRPGRLLNGNFLSFCMKVYADSGRLAEYFTGAGIPHLTGQSLSRLPFPLPPLAEQHRIVAKVDELMRWCDALEARLAAAQTTATHLLDATLRQVVAG